MAPLALLGQSPLLWLWLGLWSACFYTETRMCVCACARRVCVHPAVQTYVDVLLLVLPSLFVAMLSSTSISFLTIGAWSAAKKQTHVNIFAIICIAVADTYYYNDNVTNHLSTVGAGRLLSACRKLFACILPKPKDTAPIRSMCCHLVNCWRLKINLRVSNNVCAPTATKMCSLLHDHHNIN